MTPAFNLGCGVPLQRVPPVLLAEKPPRRCLRRAPDAMPVALRLVERIAVAAGLADLDAAPPGIESVISPGDVGFLAHQPAASSSGVNRSSTGRPAWARSVSAFSQFLTAWR